jgi:hypothetical protein
MNWLTLGFGCFMVVGGVILLTSRRRIATANANVQREVFGKPGETVAKHSTPFWVGVTGVVAIAIGAGAILSALFR